MRIDDLTNNGELLHVGLGLTESEANELRDTLDVLLEDPEARHEHVPSTGYDKELTVWIVRE